MTGRGVGDIMAVRGGGEERAVTELLFVVEGDAEGGYTARAVGESIFTEADDVDELRAMIRDAVTCHFPDEGTRPDRIELVWADRRNQ